MTEVEERSPASLFCAFHGDDRESDPIIQAFRRCGIPWGSDQRSALWLQAFTVRKVPSPAAVHCSLSVHYSYKRQKKAKKKMLRFFAILRFFVWFGLKIVWNRKAIKTNKQPRNEKVACSSQVTSSKKTAVFTTKTAVSDCRKSPAYAGLFPLSML